MTEMAKLSTDELRVIALGSMGAGLAVAYFLG